MEWTMRFCLPLYVYETIYAFFHYVLCGSDYFCAVVPFMGVDLIQYRIIVFGDWMVLEDE